MRKQTRVIQAAEAVDINLGEVESAQSRFVDAGFVNTGGREVDYAGKFLNAVKTGVQAYQGTSDYKQREREHIANARNQALTDTKDAHIRAKEADVPFDQLDAFYMQEQTGFISHLDDGEQGPLAELYKRTYSGIITEKYGSLINTSQVNAKTQHNKLAIQQAMTNVNEWDYSYYEVHDELKSQFSDSEISTIWSKAMSGKVNNLTNSFEGDIALYQTAHSQEESAVLREIKESGKTHKEWLLSHIGDPEVAEFEGNIPTLDSIVADRLAQQGHVNPLDVLTEAHKKALTQEGSDGVGSLSKLNTTEGKALTKSVKTSIETVKGVRAVMHITASIDAGTATIKQLLTATKTGNETVDTDTAQKVKTYAVQTSALWLQTIFNSQDSTAVADASSKIDALLRMNPDWATAMVGPFANEFSSKFKAAVDSGDIDTLKNILTEADNKLWNNNVGQSVRDAIAKVAPEFNDAMILSRINLDPYHIQSFASGNLIKPTKAEITETLGAEAYSNRLKFNQ